MRSHKRLGTDTMWKIWRINAAQRQEMDLITERKGCNLTVDQTFDPCVVAQVAWRVTEPAVRGMVTMLPVVCDAQKTVSHRCVLRCTARKWCTWHGDHNASCSRRTEDVQHFCSAVLQFHYSHVKSLNMSLVGSSKKDLRILHKTERQRRKEGVRAGIRAGMHICVFVRAWTRVCVREVKGSISRERHVTSHADIQTKQKEKAVGRRLPMSW